MGLWFLYLLLTPFPSVSLFVLSNSDMLALFHLIFYFVTLHSKKGRKKERGGERGRNKALVSPESFDKIGIRTDLLTKNLHTSLSCKIIL